MMILHDGAFTTKHVFIFNFLLDQRGNRTSILVYATMVEELLYTAAGGLQKQHLIPFFYSSGCYTHHYWLKHYGLLHAIMEIVK